MTIVVTGATGQLGRLTIDSLIARGTATADIVAAGRNADRLAELDSLGVKTARIDLEDGSGLDEAFAGADTLLLVSASEPGNRVALHNAAVDAAARAGITRIVYTSAPHADTSELVLAPEHKETERIIADSGIPYTFLRNGWYTENYAGDLATARQTGVIAKSTGDGRVASAARADYAEAAAVALTSGATGNEIYELTGDVAWNFSDLAAAFAAALGRKVSYTPLTPEEERAQLLSFGLDEGTAGFVVALNANIRDGVLAETGGDLSRLIGHPTTAMAETVRAMASA
ncbi:MAG: NAD(P)-dependent oxidoreductase [Microbacteriaceae bacterium]|nr:NAD(P)-dependent oxidoreductase [Microbacteriaceae bacterium]